MDSNALVAFFLGNDLNITVKKVERKRERQRVETDANFGDETLKNCTVLPWCV